MKFKTLTLLLFFIFPWQAYAAPVRDFTAHYDIKLGSSVVGKATRRLQTQTDDRFIYSYDAHATVPLLNLSKVMKTEAQLQNNQIKPLYYVTKRNDKAKYTITMFFDWANNNIRYLRKQQRGHVSLDPKRVDPLSCQLLLIDALRANEKTFTCPFIEGDRTGTYHFTVTGSERIDTPQGKVLALKVEQQRSPKRKTTMWLSLDDSYTPLKIMHEVKHKPTIVAELTALTHNS